MARNQGVKMRPHFAHYDGTETIQCYETAVHKMAKQILLNACSINLPEWSRTAVVTDILGGSHVKQVHREARAWTYAHAVEEVWMDGMRPDVVARASESEGPALLIEVRVSHAVTDEKHDLVKSRDIAMLEIDLSTLSTDSLLGKEFEEAVLRDDANRYWVHSPEGERQYRNALAELEKDVAARNKQIQADQAEAEKRRIAQRAEATKKEHRKAVYRQELRDRHSEDLAYLVDAVSPERLRNRLLDLEGRDAARIERLRQRLLGDAPLPNLFAIAHPQWWLVNAHPSLWQMDLCSRFVFAKPKGTLVNTKRWVPWLDQSFGFDPAMKRLFAAQQADSKRARAAGFPRYGPRAWFLADWENDLIPSPFEVVNYLIDRLARHNIIEQMDEWGIYEVSDGTKDAFNTEREPSPKNQWQSLPALPSAGPDTILRHTYQAPLSAVERDKLDRAAQLKTLLNSSDTCSICKICDWPSHRERRVCGRCGSSLLSSVRIALALQDLSGESCLYATAEAR